MTCLMKKHICRDVAVQRLLYPTILFIAPQSPITYQNVSYVTYLMTKT